MRKQQQALLIFGAALILSFQNCAPQQFSTPATEAVTPASSTLGSAEPTPLPLATATPGPQATATPAPTPVPVVAPPNFSCVNYVPLAEDQLTQVPARDSQGTCYYFKVASSHTDDGSVVDSDIYSRDHSNGIFNDANKIAHPTQIAKWIHNIKLTQPRIVRLTGAIDSSTAVSVDNFILAGLVPMGTTPTVANLPTMYAAYGTSDSSIDNSAGQDTHAILFDQAYISVTAFSTGGTSSVTPIQLTDRLSPGATYQLEFRALNNAGSSGGVSDVYLLFQ